MSEKSHYRCLRGSFLLNFSDITTVFFKYKNAEVGPKVSVA